MNVFKIINNSALYLLILIIQLTVTSPTLLAQGLCCDVPGWQYAVQIDIDNTCCSTTMTNYQVLLTINTQTPISQGKMNADGSDIRFLDYLCGSFLNYWIESGINTTTTQIWVTVPLISPNSITTIYMVYGNPSATAISNFNVVFPGVLTVNSAVTLGGVQNYDWIDVQAAGNISIASGSVLTLNARKIVMAGTISGNGAGYGPQAGPGAGVNGGGGVGGSGGSYGGVGGSGGGGTSSPYGTANGPDIDMGSGGGGSDCAPSASGGGAAAMYAAVIDLTGTIIVNGGSAANCCCGNSSEAAAGGSGGGILVNAHYLSGAGTLIAQGGNGGNSDTKEGGGGGSGGRIKLFYCISNSFSGTTNADGGAPGVGPQAGEQPGAVGTSTVNPVSGELLIVGNERPIQIVPNAAFNSSALCLNDTAYFTDGSTIAIGSSITVWNWTFGDGNFSTSQNTSNVYTANGSYNVTLAVTSDSGCVDSVTQPLTVFPIPVAGFTFANECQGTAISFTDNSSITSPYTITGWSWNFGNGSPANTSQSPSYLYTSVNTYNVILTVSSNTGCQGTANQNVIVFPNPVAAFTYNDTCESFPTTFNDGSSVPTGSIANWSWNFGDGSPFDNSANPTHIYSSANTYNVTLYLTTDSGCQGSITQAVLVNPIPFANFTTSNICQNGIASFADISTISTGTNISWLWDFGDGSAVNSNQNPSHQYTAAGNFTIIMAVISDKGCMDTTQQIITIYPGPVADFTAASECLGNSTGFSNLSTVGSPGILISQNWAFGDGTPLDNTLNPVHTYTNYGSYNVMLTVVSDNGCTDSISVIADVFPAPAADFLNTPVCAIHLGDPMSFTDNTNSLGSNVVAWFWDFGDGNVSTANNPANVYLSGGDYMVTLVATTDKGCTDSVTNQSSFYPAPVSRFSFSPSPATILSPEVTFTDGSYSGVISTWVWNWGDSSSATVNSDSVLMHNYSDTGTYSVQLIVTSLFGCSDSIVQEVRVNPDYILFTPSAFTPNDDDFNDTFFPVGIGMDFNNFEMSIFNRWGDLIFKTNDIKIPWDGKANNGKKLAEEGVYVWFIQSKDDTGITGAKHQHIGHVTLIR